MTYGVFIKKTRNYEQPRTLSLDLFITQLVHDAMKASSLPILQNAYVTPYYRYPSEQVLKASGINTDCIVTIQHDQDTQALYMDPAYKTSKVLQYWQRPYIINITIKNIDSNSGIFNYENIIDIKDEIINLLLFNDGVYSNTTANTETYKNIPLHNSLIEERVINGEQTSGRISHVYITLTILFTIYK